MSEREPIRTVNLDRYGYDVVPWSRPHELLTALPVSPDIAWFLSTVRPDGIPHTVGIGAVWVDGDFYITSNAERRKAKNLAENPACTLAGRLTGIDMVFEGEATLVTDQETLETVAQVYRDGGWPCEVKDGALTAPYSAPSAGPPPWYLYTFRFHTAFGITTAEPYGATKWEFAR